MTEPEQKKLAGLLKQSLAPVNRELRRDLWPQMLRRMDERRGERRWFGAMFSARTLSSVPWFDWALLVVLVIGVCIFPKSIPIWLYHL